MFRLRTVGALAALTLLVAACGGDDPQTSNTVDMDPSGDDMSDTDDMAGDGMAEDGHMDDMAGDDMSDMAEDGHDHDHSDVVLVEWPADRDLPTVAMTTEARDDGSVLVTFDVTGFAVVGGDAADIAEGAGHLHVTVDGRAAGMAFEPEMVLEGVEPGVHELVVDLAAGDHGTYASDGEPLRFTASFEVAGEVSSADVVIDVEIDENGAVGGITEASASLGDVVEIRVDSLIAEELHVHAYDVLGELIPGETTTVRFTADIPGVFEIELEGSGIQVVSLQVS